MSKEIQIRILQACSRFIARKLEPVTKRIDELALSIKSLSLTPGPQGERGNDGIDGKDGKDGRDGKDGISPAPEAVAKALEGEFAKWALDFERRAQSLFQRAIENMPTPENGKDGRDGVGIDAMEIERDAGRVIHRWMNNGEVMKEFETREHFDRGVWRETEQYYAMNGVTFSGSYWIAQKDNPENKPGEGDGWRLAVKKGRDGKRVEK